MSATANLHAGVRNRISDVAEEGTPFELEFLILGCGGEALEMLLFENKVCGDHGVWMGCWSLRVRGA
jgi:hypothetical protein